MEEFTVNCPDDLVFENQVFSIDFHPQRNLLAAGISDGNTFLYEYAPEGNKIVSTFSHNSGSSVRCVTFTPDGNHLYSAGGDKSLRATDVATGKVLFENTTSKEAINAMEAFENYIFTGDDEGCVKIWDTRKPNKAAVEIRENWDYISDLCCYSNQNTLFATGGDERMSVIDFRKGKLIEVSQDQEDELLCVQVVKGGRKVVVGSQLGVLLLWSWGQWLDTTDRYPGHPESIDCMVAIDDDTVITGSADGVIRIVNILPNRMIGIVGEHDDDMPVQRLAIDHEKQFLGSASDDNTIKFWNIKFLFEDDGNNDDDDEVVEEEEEEENLEFQKVDQDDDQDDDDEDDDEEEEEEEFSSSLSSSSDDDDDDGEGGVKSKVRARGRGARIPLKRKRDGDDDDDDHDSSAADGKSDESSGGSDSSSSASDENENQGNDDNDDDNNDDDGDEEEEEARVKPDAKQKLSALFTSLPVGEKLSLKERRDLIKQQRQLKKSIKQQRKEKKEAAVAAKQAQQPKKEKAQSNKKRKVGEHNEASNFFSDL